MTYTTLNILQVTEIQIPDTFDGTNLQSDIAILRLDSNTRFESCASPICLPYDENEDFEFLQADQFGRVQKIKFQLLRCYI